MAGILHDACCGMTADDAWCRLVGPVVGRGCYKCPCAFNGMISDAVAPQAGRVQEVSHLLQYGSAGAVADQHRAQGPIDTKRHVTALTVTVQ